MVEWEIWVGAGIDDGNGNGDFGWVIFLRGERGGVSGDGERVFDGWIGFTIAWVGMYGKGERV